MRGVLTELRVVARSVLGANFITSAAQAAVATGGFFIARAPSPIFFGLLTLITSMIPSIGSALVTLPVAGLLLLTGHRWAALFLMVWGLFVVGLIDNLLRPVLIKGGAANLHGALIFFSLIGAIAAFGAIGLFLGPLVLTFFLALARQSVERPRSTPSDPTIVGNAPRSRRGTLPNGIVGLPTGDDDVGPAVLGTPLVRVVGREWAPLAEPRRRIR